MPREQIFQTIRMLVKRTNTLGIEIEPETRTAEAMMDEAVAAA